MKKLRCFVKKLRRFVKFVLGVEKVSAIQDLQPYINDYPKKIKEARKNQGITLQKLTDATGVPQSTINNLNADKQVYPKLYDAAAICKVLGLSLDELFGLEHKNADELRHLQELHELEIQNVQRDDEIKRLNDVGAERERRLLAHINILAAVVALFVLVIIGYMIFDIHILDAGLFQQSNISVFGVVLFIAVLGAVAELVRIVKYVWEIKKRPR